MPAGAASAWVVTSVHLGLDADERVRHAEVVRELVAAYQGERGVIAGDLNERPGGRAWSTLSHGFGDPGRTADAPTYPARGPASRIDVVFVPDGVDATSRVVTGPAVVAASDHCPVVVDVVA